VTGDYHRLADQHGLDAEPQIDSRKVGTKLLSALTTIGLVVGVIVVPGTAVSQEVEQPNVLVIVADDLNRLTTKDELRQLSETRSIFAGDASTPDRTGFHRAVVTTPTCCPSRTSIFTGKYAHNHGVLTNEIEMPWGAGAFDPTHSIQYVLRQAGYRTGIAGKYLNGIGTSRAPHFDFADGWDAECLCDPTLAAQSFGAFLDQAEAENDAQPWLFFLTPHSPHKPWTVEPDTPQPLPEWVPGPAYQEADRSDKHPKLANKYFSWSQAQNDTYFREVQAVDELVGEAFATLDRLEETNTLAFFVSDNGYLFGDHHLHAKHWPYSGDFRVPLYMRWPGHDLIPDPGEYANRGRLDIAANIDIAPTIYEATGVDPTAYEGTADYVVDGRSLLHPTGRTRILVEFPQGIQSSLPPEQQFAPGWRQIWSPGRAYIRWVDAETCLDRCVEDYNGVTDPDHPYQLNASNVPDPLLDIELANAAVCPQEVVTGVPNPCP
jgi:arylsulfatase A-like enzyme